MQGARFLDECVVSNGTLTSLDISMNRIGGNGQFIASMLSRGPPRSDINVSNNDLCGMYGEEDLMLRKRCGRDCRARALTALDLLHVTIDCGKIIVEELEEQPDAARACGIILKGRSCEGRCLANQRLAAARSAEDVDDYDDLKDDAAHCLLRVLG